MSRELVRALTAEAIGTFALVFAGCGAVMVEAKTHQLGHVGVAITFGLVIMFGIYAVGHAPPDLRAESAGQSPAEAIWPNVIEAMREVGIDISDRRPKKIELEMQLHADKAITLNCQDTCPYVIGGVEDWDVDDPAGQPLEKVREIRDEIEQRVRNLVQERADEIRAERSGHARRLAQLLPNLVTEFDGTRTPEEIRTCADAILEKYDDAPVRSFVLTLADRDARNCLRANNCYALARD